MLRQLTGPGLFTFLLKKLTRVNNCLQMKFCVFTGIAPKVRAKWISG